MPPDLKRAVCFISAKLRDEDTGHLTSVVYGTAFFVSVPLNPIGYAFEPAATYVVTAGHILDAIRADASEVQIRVNVADGPLRELSVPEASWQRHPNTDVALAPIAFASNDDQSAISSWMLADESHLDENERSGDGPLGTHLFFGEGDDVFLIGLFSEHYGQERNHPVMRFGKISLMPREQLHVELSPGTFADMDGYLVESLSWGGQSGSPAFVYSTTTFNGVPVIGSYRLMGLVQGHYEINKKVKFAPDENIKGDVKVNSGLAVVIPAHHITELLMDPERVREREQAWHEHQRELAY